MRELTHAELFAVIERARAGDGDAWEVILARCDRKMKVLARAKRLDGHEIEDREQIAFLGLAKAVKYFKPDGGRNFDTYAEMVINDFFTDRFRRLTAPAQVPLRALRSSEEPIGDELTLGESVADERQRTEIDDAEAFQALKSMIKKLERVQAQCLRDHLKRPLTTPFGDVLCLWSLHRKGREEYELLLDVLKQSWMMRTMRFGHTGDLFKEVGPRVWDSFLGFLKEQRELILRLSRDEESELDEVQAAMRKLIEGNDDVSGIDAIKLWTSLAKAPKPSRPELN